MYEFLKVTTTTGQGKNTGVNITTATFIADGIENRFSVGTNIGTLFSVSINGLGQIRDLNYTFIDYTSTVTFLTPPLKGSVITIQFYKGINSVILDNTGKLVQFSKEEFVYNTTLQFNLSNSINSLMTVETNGLAEEDVVGYDISTDRQITYRYAPVVGSKISISYFY